MENYIGIIVAELEELNAIKSVMSNISNTKLYNLEIFLGKINEKNCILTKCGVGKVNAARTTQILTDNFNLKYIINLGSACAANEALNIGDIVIGTKLVQHDFDVTAFGREKGYISETGKFFESSPDLIRKFINVKLDNIKIIPGLIASGDIFCTSPHMKNKIKENFGCDCIEMEGAAIAQVCFLNNIPFIVIRSISDVPNGNNHIEFNEFLKLASKNCATLIKNL